MGVERGKHPKIPGFESLSVAVKIEYRRPAHHHESAIARAKARSIRGSQSGGSVWLEPGKVHWLFSTRETGSEIKSEFDIIPVTFCLSLCLICGHSQEDAWETKNPTFLQGTLISWC